LLINAGLEVISRRGWAATTVKSVCAEAGLTERYFYEAFPDREALLIAVFDTVRDEVTAVVVDAVLNTLDGELRDRVRAPIAAGLILLTDDQRKGRLLLLAGSDNPLLNQRRHDAMLTTAALLSQLAQTYYASHPVGPDDALMTATGLVGAETALLAAYIDGQVTVSRERLIEHITDIHLAAAAGFVN
jgi:AcrR family transcriptional regulator